MNKKKIIFITVILFCLLSLLTLDYLPGVTGGDENQVEALSGMRLKAYNQGNYFTPAREKQYVEGQLLVKTKTSLAQSTEPWKKKPQVAAEERLLKKYKAVIKKMKRLATVDSFLIETTPGADILEFEAQLRQDPSVADVSLNYIASITSLSPKLPNDTFFAYQYALHNTGQVYIPNTEFQGSSGSDIKATAGWPWTTGSEGVIIAVIDTGVAFDHEDLAGKVLPGYNFIDLNANTYDDHGHGTLVSSIAAANTNNDIGIAGISWESKILPLKAMDSEGYGDHLAIASAIKYAADEGAKVINLSLGGEFSSFVLEDACRYAFQKGCVIVASTGNESLPVYYPAAYDTYCLAVAATDEFDNWVDWSNFGPQVDVAAPGVNVLGAYFDPAEPGVLDWYAFGSGTSFSAPMVTGAAALLYSYKSFLSNQQVMDLIRYTADDINQTLYPGIDHLLGYGRINLETLLAPYEVQD